MIRIAEIFESIQGEGGRAGVPSVFVRTSGCNLRCLWCDTPYASWNPEGDRRRWEAIRDEVLACESHDVVLTGGEPMLVADLIPLTDSLREAGRTITIETAGTVLPPGYAERPPACDLMSISPKRANSTPDGDWRERHESRRDAPEVIAELIARYAYQFKFVVDSPDDMDDVEGYLAAWPQLDRSRVFLMPQATDPGTLQTKTDWLRPLAESRGLKVSPRIHVQRWGNRRGV